MPSSSLVMLSVTRSHRFLRSMFEAKNISRLSPFYVVAVVQALPRAWPSRLQCLDAFLSAFRSPLSGMFLAVSNSSWSVIARTTRRAAPFKLPTSRAATELTSRFSPLLHKRPSWWQSHQPLGSPAYRGRFSRSCQGFRRLIPDHDRLSRFMSKLRNELKFPASFAVNLEMIRLRLRYHCGARESSVSRSGKRAPQAVWSRRLRTAQVSQCKWSVN